MQYGRGAAGWPGRLGCTAPGQLCAPHDAGPRAGWVGADRADRISCGATACSALNFGPTRMDRNEPILLRPRESPRVTTGIPYMCPLDRHTWDVRHRTGATPPSSDAWALRARRRMTPRARSSGGPLRLVVRVVRVDASAARAALGSGSEDRASASHGRMLSAGWARWVRVGLAPCSNTSDVGWAAILAILTCHCLSTPPEWEVWCVPLSSHPRMCR